MNCDEFLMVSQPDNKILCTTYSPQQDWIDEEWTGGEKILFERKLVQVDATWYELLQVICNFVKSQRLQLGD